MTSKFFYVVFVAPWSLQPDNAAAAAAASSSSPRAAPPDGTARGGSQRSSQHVPGNGRILPGG